MEGTNLDIYRQCTADEGDLSAASCSAEADRLKRGLQDIHDRASGKRGNPKWIVGHLENLLAGREYDVWG